MNKDNVFNFIFVEDRFNPQDELEPFVYEMLQTNIPFIFVTDEPLFSIYLGKFSKDQLVSVWIHHQANHNKTDKFGRYLGENTGAKLIDKYPGLKFKYVTRAPEHPLNSNDKKRSPIISLNDIYDEIKDSKNFQKISDFNIEQKKSEIQNSSNPVNTATGGKLINN
jgi:hypothetical protein